MLTLPEPSAWLDVSAVRYSHAETVMVEIPCFDVSHHSYICFRKLRGQSHQYCRVEFLGQIWYSFVKVQ